jgi:kumamolisin
MAATIRLAGSGRRHHNTSATVAPQSLTTAQLAAPAVMTLHLREAPGGESLGVRLARQHLTPASRRRFIGPGELIALHGAAAVDIHQVSAWATGAGLRVRPGGAGTATVDVSGSVGALASAFGVGMVRCHDRDPRSGAVSVYRDHLGELSIPAHLDGVITAALGLSDRPIARSRLAVLPRGVTAPHSYTAEQIAGIYDFPRLADGGDGATITVGIAELGGAVQRADVAALMSRNPRLRIVEEAVNGWGPRSDPLGADTEVALDWQVIAGVLAHCAPLAHVHIIIKYAPNTDRGFTNLEASFATDGRDYSAVSTSWGAPETLWSASAMDAMDRAFQLGAVRGIVHAVAAGDNGSTDAGDDGRQHADHPASAPHALGCGGTRLVAVDGRRVSEEAWNELGVGQGATGGGVSDHFDVPRYQSMAAIQPTSANGPRQGRGVPDVAGNADPLTGYRVHHLGTDSVVGGTSAVAPLWAALLAVVSASTGHRLGAVHPTLYAARHAGFNDITGGDNGAYRALTGWDAVTGLGTPAGRRLCDAVRTSISLPGMVPTLRLAPRRNRSASVTDPPVGAARERGIE